MTKILCVHWSWYVPKVTRNELTPFWLTKPQFLLLALGQLFDWKCHAYRCDMKRLKFYSAYPSTNLSKEFSQIIDFPHGRYFGHHISQPSTSRMQLVSFINSAVDTGDLWIFLVTSLHIRYCSAIFSNHWIISLRIWHSVMRINCLKNN